MFFFFCKVPDAVTIVWMQSPEKNVIKADCYHPGRFNGPEKKFIARLYVSGEALKLLKEETQENCYFVFKDLSNSTTHMVKVCIIQISKHTFPKHKMIPPLFLICLQMV